MIRSRNLVSPFADGELPTGESPSGDVASVVRESPFASLTLAHRLKVRAEARRPAETMEVEPPPLPELASEQSTEPEAETADLSELLLLPEGASTEEAAPTDETSPPEESGSTEGEAFRMDLAIDKEDFDLGGALRRDTEQALDEEGFDLAGELRHEVEEAVELEADPELESTLAQEREGTREVEREEARGDEQELEPEAAEDETAGGEHEGPEQEDENPRGTITVVFDEPTEADDTFTLESKGGAYHKAFASKEAKPLVAGVKVLRFDDADTTKEYQLLHKRSAASTPRRIFAMPKAFVGLTEHHDARKPRAFIPSSTQAPEVTSGHRVDRSLIDHSPGLTELTDVRA
jgi:hypothetical protein